MFKQKKERKGGNRKHNNLKIKIFFTLSPQAQQNVTLSTPFKKQINRPNNLSSCEHSERWYVEYDSAWEQPNTLNRGLAHICIPQINNSCYYEKKVEILTAVYYHMTIFVFST